jgi:hypothetical protein
MSTSIGGSSASDSTRHQNENAPRFEPAKSHRPNAKELEDAHEPKHAHFDHSPILGSSSMGECPCRPHGNFKARPRRSCHRRLRFIRMNLFLKVSECITAGNRDSVQPEYCKPRLFLCHVTLQSGSHPHSLPGPTHVLCLHSPDGAALRMHSYHPDGPCGATAQTGPDLDADFSLKSSGHVHQGTIAVCPVSKNNTDKNRPARAGMERRPQRPSAALLHPRTHFTRNPAKTTTTLPATTRNHFTV